MNNNQNQNNTNQNLSYEQQVNELINSVTMADLEDPSVVQKKKRNKGIIIGVVIFVCLFATVFVVLLSTGTLSTLGPKTTSELDVFKTETKTSEITNDPNIGKYKREGNNYTLDTENASNGKTIKYYLSTKVTVYITYAADYTESGKFTFNINETDYIIDQEQMGDLKVNISSNYIIYSNSKYEEQYIFFPNGKKYEKSETEEQTSNSNASNEEVTTTTTTAATHTINIQVENTTDANGRTTTIYTDYSNDLNNICFIWQDEDLVNHPVGYGTEECKALGLDKER